MEIYEIGAESQWGSK